MNEGSGDQSLPPSHGPGRSKGPASALLGLSKEPLYWLLGALPLAIGLSFAQVLEVCAGLPWVPVPGARRHVLGRVQ